MLPAAHVACAPSKKFTNLPDLPSPQGPALFKQWAHPALPSITFREAGTVSMPWALTSLAH